jgi:hypothetical protein
MDHRKEAMVAVKADTPERDVNPKVYIALKNPVTDKFELPGTPLDEYSDYEILENLFFMKDNPKFWAVKGLKGESPEEKRCSYKRRVEKASWKVWARMTQVFKNSQKR